MADFYPVLSRAVGALPANTAEARRSIYERARGALVAQLRSMQPALSEEQILAQAAALDDAARRIEAEYAARPVEAPPAHAPFASPLSPSPEGPARAQPPEADRQPPTAPVRPVERADSPLNADAPATPLSAPPPMTADGEDRDMAEAPAPEAAPVEPAPPPRPRIAPPERALDTAGRKRTMIVGGGIALAVLGIAIAAYVVNSSPPQPAKPNAPVIAPRAGGNGSGNAKMNDRVGAEQPAPAAGGVAQPALPVAQRAVLYIETPDNPQQPRTVGGRVAWRLDSESAGAGRPVDTVVRATVELPEIGLSLVFTIRLNTDAALPASHIIGLRFSRTSDDGNGAVKEAGVPQFKTDEGERGAPLSAISSALGDNLFVVALSNVPVEVERNVQLMTRRNWIDIPIRFASGKRGIIAFEKGFSGDQTITDAFNRWR
jgi:hypothetical protein